MTLREWIASLFLPPCLHAWETVATLHDDPDKPTATTLVQVCVACGETRQTVFKSPEPPKRACSPHKWAIIGYTDILPDDTYEIGRDKVIPHASIERMQCQNCGERKDHRVNSDSGKAK